MKNTTSMTGKKPFTCIGAIMFALVCLAHLLRIIFGWNIELAGVFIPDWISVIVCLVSAGLSYAIWRELKV